MPSKNPRLSVVLPPALAATLAALAEETGESASSLVRGILEQAQPALQRMVELVRAANKAKGQIGAGVGGALGRVVDDLEDAMAVADSRVRRVTGDLVDTAQAIKGRRRQPARPGALAAPGGRVSAEVVTPVPVTRGSGGVGKAQTRGRRGGRVRAV